MNETEQVLSSILFPPLLFSCSDSYNIRFYCCSKDRMEEERERYTERQREEISSSRHSNPKGME